MRVFEEYLRPTKFIDFDNRNVQEYAIKNTSKLNTDKEKAVALYYAVRDDIQYSPWGLVMNPDEISASLTLKRAVGYCIEKSLLLAACARFVGIPSRLGFSIVRNHISSDKFVAILRTDKFVFHGYNEFWLDNHWVKCTPAFNKSLCEKFKTQPLEFNGDSDSIFQQFSAEGRQYMEYLHEYGTFADFPYSLFEEELRRHYPHLFTGNGKIIFTQTTVQ